MIGKYWKQMALKRKGSSLTMFERVEKADSYGL